MSTTERRRLCVRHSPKEIEALGRLFEALRTARTNLDSYLEHARDGEHADCDGCHRCRLNEDLQGIHWPLKLFYEIASSEAPGHVPGIIENEEYAAMLVAFAEQDAAAEQGAAVKADALGVPTARPVACAQVATANRLTQDDLDSLYFRLMLTHMERFDAVAHIALADHAKDCGGCELCGDLASIRYGVNMLMVPLSCNAPPAGRPRDAAYLKAMAQALTAGIEPPPAVDFPAEDKPREADATVQPVVAAPQRRGYEFL